MNSPSDAPTPDDADLGQSLAEAEQSLEQLKARYLQVQQDLQDKAALQADLAATQAEYRRQRIPALRSEIKQLQHRIEELEIALESQLVSWGWVRETFWQVVRFGGLGVILGWLLRSWAS